MITTTTIFVDDKPYYINKFDDFLGLVRDKISPDAEKYLNSEIINKATLINDLENDIDNSDDSEYDIGWNDGLRYAIDCIKN